MLKIDSNITELPISPGIDKPSIVITGSSAFLKAWENNIFDSLMPLALAAVI